MKVAGLAESSNDSVVRMPLLQSFCISSTYAAVITAVWGIAGGADAYLEKDCDPDDVAREIRRIVRTRRQRTGI